MKTDGTPDFYMNFVIGLVYKWFGRDMLERLFDSWLGDVRQAVMDDLAWLALESAVYQKELPGRPALEELRQDHAREFFCHGISDLPAGVDGPESAGILHAGGPVEKRAGKAGPAGDPWDKGLYRALCCGDVSGEELEQALRACFRKYLGFDGKVRTKAELRLHFDNRRWIAFMTKMAPTELVRTDDLAIGRAAHAGQAGFVGRRTPCGPCCAPTSGRRRTGRISSGASGGYVRPQAAERHRAAASARGNHLGCRLWFTRGTRRRTCRPAATASSCMNRRRNRLG
ncbi:MAG: hypothetical protein ACLR5H_07175 [Oscillospiraceae bacterium]